MALGLKRRELTPQEEAQRQIRIQESIEQEREQERQRVRDLNAENARRNQENWQRLQAEAEARRMEALAAEQQRDRDKADKEREAAAARSAALMQTYREARDRVAELDREIGALQNTPNRTGLQQAELIGWRQLRESADARLIEAEKGIGRHRS